MNSFNAPTEWATDVVKITLVGCGGTGSSMLDELFRMHMLLLRLDHPGLFVEAWDPDEVSEANIGRQRFWPADVGYNKAELLVNRYNSFGGTNWKAKGEMFSHQMCGALTSDVLLTCVDRPEVRAAIGKAGAKFGKRSSCLWLDTGNDDSSGQVILGHLAGRKSRKDALPNVFDLYPSLANQKSSARPSCSTEEALRRQDFGINQRVAGEASGLLWQLLRHGKLNRHGSYVYQEHGEVLPLPIGEEAWQAFG